MTPKNQNSTIKKQKNIRPPLFRSETRHILQIGDTILKIPKISQLFDGLSANRRELELSSTQNPNLIIYIVPTKWRALSSLLLGLVVFMPKVTEATPENRYVATLFDNFVKDGRNDGIDGKINDLCWFAPNQMARLRLFNYGGVCTD